MSPRDHITNKSLQRYDSIQIPVGPRSPTPYPCEETVMAELNPANQPNPGQLLHQPLLHLFDAVRRLEAFHAPNVPRATSAWELLSMLQVRRRLSNLHMDDLTSGRACGWYGDVAQKAFPDLDHGLFEGRLRGKVSLAWVSDEDEADEVGRSLVALRHPAELVRKRAMTCAPGDWYINGGMGRGILICLNAEKLLLDGRKSLKVLVDALIREMVVSLSPLRSPILPPFPYTYPLVKDF